MKQIERQGMKNGARTLALFLSMLLVGTGLGLAKSIQLGLHAGISIPNIQGGNNPLSQGYSSRLGPFFGIFADFSLAPHLSLRTELNYSSKGGKRNGLQPTGMDPTLFGLPVGTLIYANFNNETIIDYVEIPVLLKLAWGHGLRYFVKAGPHFGYRVKAKTLTSGMSLLYLDEAGTQPIPMVPEQDFTASTDVKSETRSTNYGISGGAGIETAFGPGTIILEALFSYDLNYTQINTAVNGKNHNGAVVISVGYAFSLIK